MIQWSLDYPTHSNNRNLGHSPRWTPPLIRTFLWNCTVGVIRITFRHLATKVQYRKHSSLSLYIQSSEMKSIVSQCCKSAVYNNTSAESKSTHKNVEHYGLYRARETQLCGTIQWIYTWTVFTCICMRITSSAVFACCVCMWIFCFSSVRMYKQNIA